MNPVKDYDMNGFLISACFWPTIHSSPECVQHLMDIVGESD